MRRILLRVHLSVALVSGLYILVVCVTGAALLFRVDIQRARHPRLFTPAAEGPIADPVAVMERVSQAYPGYRLAGVEAPTSRRATSLAYVTRGNDFLTVLIDPVTTEILGELPEDRLVGFVQNLHFNLVSGRTGRTVNGLGAVCMFVLCVTGLVIWWPVRKRPARSSVWRLHRAVGIWTVAFTMMFAITGFAFAFPAAFRSAVGAISPITTARAPQSAEPPAGTSPPSWSAMIARSRLERRGEHVARVVLPFDDRAAFQVMFAGRAPTPSGTALSSVYLDQYSGEVLAAAPASRTFGDIVMAWITPLHVGGVGGTGLRLLWFVLALMPPLLFVSGITMWWARRRPR